MKFSIKVLLLTVLVSASLQKHLSSKNHRREETITKKECLNRGGKWHDGNCQIVAVGTPLVQQPKHREETMTKKECKSRGGKWHEGNCQIVAVGTPLVQHKP